MWKSALWLLVPVLGLAELGAQFYDARRAPREAEWQDIAPVIRRMRSDGEAVIVAPYWAEPWARHVLGDGQMPLAQVARPDASPFPRVVEVSILGQNAPELRGWQVEQSEQHGRFRVRVMSNPEPISIRYDFVNALGPAAVHVRGPSGECAWTERARVENGGLGGHPTYPAHRFNCSGGGSHFVGVTVIDDKDYRPRRCIWASPAVGGPLSVTFKDVPLGASIYGYAGSPWVMVRDGDGSPVTLQARVNGEVVGSHVQRDQMGWARFSFSTAQFSGRRAAVEISVTSDDYQKPFCFYADAR